MTGFLNTAYYFGCHRRSGHYLFAPQMRDAGRTAWHDRMTYLDGSLAPEKDDVQGAYEPQFYAKFWRLTGYTPIPYSAISWWDRSVDSRHASNSIIFAPGHTVSAEVILELAQQHFPQVMGRLPSIQLLSGVHERTWQPKKR